jgi:hypothetical protein
MTAERVIVIPTSRGQQPPPVKPDRRFIMSLLLGSTAPNFTIDSTAGQINFHDWAGDS